MNEETLPEASGPAAADPPPASRPASGTVPLRVLHVESGQEWRSTRNQVSLLVQGLQRQGNVHQAVASLARSRLAVDSEQAGVPVIPLPWAVGTDPRALRTLARHARRGWDVYHAHDSHALRLLVYLSALEGSTARLVASRRIPVRPRSPWKWRRAHLVLAVSTATREAAIAAGVDRGRVVVVPNGLDPSGLEPQRPGRLRAVAAADPDHFLIGSLAALAPDRDHATLVRAAALVTKRYPAARFAVFGDGPERHRLEGMIDALGLAGRVCLPGYVADARLSLTDLDLYVMPSRWEDLSTACLEAMWLGIPSIMTSDGHTAAEGIEPVRQGDHAALAEAIGRLIEDAEYRRQLGLQARSHAGIHSADEMVRRTLQCYRLALTVRGR